MDAADRFVASFLALLVELWQELDELLALFDDDPARLAAGVEILRLELELLDAACTRLVDRGLLTAPQSLRVRVLLDDVRWIVSPPEIAALALPSLEAAQDRIYDEMQGVLATHSPVGARVH